MVGCYGKFAGLTLGEIKEIYAGRYAQKKKYDFDLKDTPFLGVPNAIRFVTNGPGTAVAITGLML